MPSVLLGASAVTLLGVTACGAGTDRTPGGAGTRAVMTDLGQVEVPNQPRRVVSADYFPAFALKDLGLKPIAVCEYTAKKILPEYQDLLRLPTIGPNGQPSPEKIANLKPDLIVSLVTVPDSPG